MADPENSAEFRRKTNKTGENFEKPLVFQIHCPPPKVVAMHLFLSPFLHSLITATGNSTMFQDFPLFVCIHPER